MFLGEGVKNPGNMDNVIYGQALVIYFDIVGWNINVKKILLVEFWAKANQNCLWS